jgi:hypothetical protein
MNTKGKLSLDYIEGLIEAEYYHVFHNTTTTICGLRLKNGFIAVGHSTPIREENFDAELGRRVARENAIKNIWQLEGYLLKQKLHEETKDT